VDRDKGDAVGFIICLVTTSGAEEARRIGEAVVDDGLAACCNIVTSVESIYRWEGKIVKDLEALCIFKTRKDLFEKFKDRVLDLHSYEVPEVVAFDIIAGSDKYLKWLGDACGTMP